MPNKKKPNVLWIMADQMRADCMGIMGNEHVITPNLDALAKNGCLFEHAFTQAPLCGPSRAGLFTGRYAHAHGVWWNGIHISDRFPLLPRILRENGYTTALVGKLHFWPPGKDFGFHYEELHEEGLPKDSPLSAYETFLKKHGKLEEYRNHNVEWINRKNVTGLCKMEEEFEETNWVSKRACDYIKSAGDEPFFLYASFKKPHTPFSPLPRYAELYKDVDVPPPPFSREEWSTIPPRIPATPALTGRHDLTPEELAQARRHYYALCTQVDANAGRILQCLEDAGLKDSTIVIFTSDHGEYAGEHGLIGKGECYDGALRVPLIMRLPGMTAKQDTRTEKNRTANGNRGSRYSTLVENIDIMPTLLELCGIDNPMTVQGKSLLPLLRGETTVHKEQIFSEWITHALSGNLQDLLDVTPCRTVKAVRTGKWKYVHYAGEPGELYDLKTDPGEQNNLFGLAEYSEIITEMRLRLLDWLLKTEDQKPSPPGYYNRESRCI